VRYWQFASLPMHAREKNYGGVACADDAVIAKLQGQNITLTSEPPAVSDHNHWINESSVMQECACRSSSIDRRLLIDYEGLTPIYVSYVSCHCNEPLVDCIMFTELFSDYTRWCKCNSSQHQSILYIERHCVSAWGYCTHLWYWSVCWS
jgi:hypothetical protein